MKKNDQYQVTISNISSDGNGVAFYNSIPIFVPYSAIGDVAIVRIEKVEKRYSYGRIVNLINPSSSRIPSDCPLFEKCGGCSFRHITYEEELKAKQQFVDDAVKRIGKIDHHVNKILSTNKIEYYRNKAQFPIGGISNELYPGFFAPRSHRLLQFPTPCKLQPVVFDELAHHVCYVLAENGCSVYNEESHTGLIRHILIRQSSVTNGLLLTIIINGNTLPNKDQILSEIITRFPSVESISININTNKGNTILTSNTQTLFGNDYITDEILGVPVEITPLSFFQINHSSTELLYTTIKNVVEKIAPKTVIDLYCGTGTIGLSVTNDSQVLYGIEIVEDAIRSAMKSAKIMGRSNTHFICGDSGKIEALIDEGVIPDLIITDPPRKGCSPEVLQQIIRSKCPNLIMVSCNAATLARDLQILATNDYTIDEIQPLDMFPRTKHVETVVLLSQQKPKDQIVVDLDLSELDLTSAEAKATYKEIQDYVLKKYGLKVSNLYVSQIKRKCGLEMGQNYNLSKSDNARVPVCPPEKEAAIMDALRHFKMI